MKPPSGNANSVSLVTLRLASLSALGWLETGLFVLEKVTCLLWFGHCLPHLKASGLWQGQGSRPVSQVFRHGGKTTVQGSVLKESGVLQGRPRPSPGLGMSVGE